MSFVFKKLDQLEKVILEKQKVTNDLMREASSSNLKIWKLGRQGQCSRANCLLLRGINIPLQPLSKFCIEKHLCTLLPSNNIWFDGARM